jgi:hypothetical protein
VNHLPISHRVTHRSLPPEGSLLGSLFEWQRFGGASLVAVGEVEVAQPYAEGEALRISNGRTVWDWKTIGYASSAPWGT